MAKGSIFAMMCAAAAVAGCATPYQEMGVLGGVRATRLTNDTAQVAAAGNGYTDPDTIQRYALRRAAEETVADGFDLFRIVGDADRTRTGTATYGSVTGSRYGAYLFGFSEPIVKPGQTLMIKMLKGPAPDPMPDGMFDARELLSHLGGTPYNGAQRNCVPGTDGKIVCK